MKQRAIDTVAITIGVAEAVTGLCCGRTVGRKSLKRWRRANGGTVPASIRNGMDEVGKTLLNHIAEGRVRARGVPWPDGNTAENLSHDLLMDGCFMDAFVEVEVRLDWEIERNFGLKHRGYRDVQLNLSDLEREFQFSAVLRTGEPNRLLQPSEPLKGRRSTESVKYSRATLRTWYREVYVPANIARLVPPNRDDDVIAARQYFERKIPTRAIREMRRDHAPQFWTAQGRRPTSS